MELEFYPTLKCNLKCSYCYHGEKDSVRLKQMLGFDSLPIHNALRIVEKYHTPNEWIIFIGGEPLLNVEWIEELMEEIDKIGFNPNYEIVTNGTLLKRQNTGFLKKIRNITISIDGPEEIHDSVRGIGSWKKVIENVRWARGFVEDDYTTITGRATIMGYQDSYEIISSLIPFFKSIIFQFVNGMDVNGLDSDKRWKEIKNLIDLWAGKLRTPERIIINPFDTIMKLFKGVRKQYWGLQGCRAGWNLIHVFNDGNLYGCTEHLLEEYNKVGTVEAGMVKPYHLADFETTEKCVHCDVFFICGCRCVFNVHESYCRVIKKTAKYFEELAPSLMDIEFDFPRDVESMF